MRFCLKKSDESEKEPRQHNFHEGNLMFQSNIGFPSRLAYSAVPQILVVDLYLEEFALLNEEVIVLKPSDSLQMLSLLEWKVEPHQNAGKL